MNLRALAPWRNEPKSQVTGAREDSLDPFVVFRREIDRMFDGFFDAYGQLACNRPSDASRSSAVSREPDVQDNPSGTAALLCGAAAPASSLKQSSVWEPI